MKQWQYTVYVYDCNFILLFYRPTKRGLDVIHFVVTVYYSYYFTFYYLDMSDTKVLCSNEKMTLASVVVK